MGIPESKDSERRKMREHRAGLVARNILLLLLSVIVVILFSNIYIRQNQKGKMPITFGLCFSKSAAATTEGEKTQDHSEPSKVDNKETGHAATEAATGHEGEEGKAANYASWQDFFAFFLAILLFAGAYAIIKRKAVQPPKK